MRTSAIRVAVCASLAAILFGPAPHARGADLDARAIAAATAAARQAWGVPGLAVAVVQGDAILLDASGLRSLATREPMTPETVCGIGSVTKAMTATTLARLVQDGKAAWDDPVRKHLAWFRLGDPLADRDVTLRDLLCHRIGLARHDVLWFHAPWSVEESVRRLAFLDLDAPFRTAYRYNNLAYMAAGLAIEQAAGAPWPEVMRDRLHRPLGMTRTVFRRADARAFPDRGSPHYANDGKWEPAEWYDDDKQTRASGSVKSCARDLAAWLRFHLRGGLVDGKPLLDRKHLDETYRPHTVMPVPPARAEHAGTLQMSYALGWIVSDYRGRLLLEHGGSVDGFRAAVYLLPKQKAAVAVLTNCTEAGAAQALGLTLVDRLLGGETTNWHKVLKGSRDATTLARQVLIDRRTRERHADTKPSRPLEAYAGTYRDRAYGDAVIEVKDGKLWLKWSGFREPLEHYHFDTFSLPERSKLTTDLLVFSLRPTGDVGGFRLLGREFGR